VRSTSGPLLGLAASLFLAGPAVTAHAQDAPVRLITLDPGHFHAGLIQKEMYPGVAETVHVFAPLGPDLLAHLGRVAAFNGRRENPTRWKLEVHAGPGRSRACCARSPATWSSSPAATGGRSTPSWPASRAA
jgi:hypothetical protein